MFTLGPIPLSLPPLSVNKPLLNPLKYFGKASVGTHALVSLVHGKRLPPKMWSPPLESTKTPKNIELTGKIDSVESRFPLGALVTFTGTDTETDVPDRCLFFRQRGLCFPAPEPPPLPPWTRRRTVWYRRSRSLWDKKGTNEWKKPSRGLVSFVFFHGQSYLNDECRSTYRLHKTLSN